jgi:hypothetical protein
MRGKRQLRTAAIALTIGTVAGCGGAAGVGPATVPASSSPPPTTTPDPTISAAYCQWLSAGNWVTNDSAYSTTPCVPDPSDATGDEQADASVAMPRCFSCKLSDWARAELRAARRRGLPSPGSNVATAASASTGADRWSPRARSGFISGCAENMVGVQCGCLADQLERQVSADQAPSLAGDDPRLPAATQACKS